MKKVTKNVQEIIKKRYPFENSKKLAEELGFSYHTIMKWAQKLKLKKDKSFKSNTISKEHEELLRKYYPTCDLDWLCKQMGKNKHAICMLAHSRGIKREVNDLRNGDMSPLLDGSLQSMYWLGFLAADGYISKTGHMLCSQSEKDKSNIYRFAEYLNTSVYIYKSNSGYNTKSKTYRVGLSHPEVALKIRDMMCIQKDRPKTYTGICLDFIESEDQAVAFLVGFIDGDGSLTDSKNYMIQCHESWLSTFEVLQNKLPKIFEDTYLRLRERKDKNMFVSVWGIRIAPSRYLRKFVEDKNLSCSDRKFKL